MKKRKPKKHRKASATRENTSNSVQRKPTSEPDGPVTSSRKRWNRYGDLMIAGGIALLFVMHFFFTDDYFLGSGTDIISLEYPVHRFATHWLRQGVLPLWNPHIFGGIPFQAGVHGYLYPGLWTGLLLPAGLDIKVGIALHLILAATGGAYLARGLMRKMIPRAATGIVYALSGFMMLHLFAGHRIIIMTAAYLPWIASALHRVLNGEKRALIWGTAALGLMMLSGHYQIVFIGLLGIFIWLLFDVWLSPDKPLSPFTEKWPRVVVIGIVLLLGVGIAAVQIIPAMLNAGLSQRSGDDFAFAASFSSAPLNLLSYLFPHFFGNKVDAPFIGNWSYWESLGYVGVIPFCLIIAAHTVLPWRRVFPKSIVIILATILSLGAHTPLFDVYVSWIPGADLFRSPGRFCLLVALFGGIITGEMLDVLFGQERNAQSTRKASPSALVAMPRTLFWPTALTPLVIALGALLWFYSWKSSDVATCYTTLLGQRSPLPENVAASLLVLVNKDLMSAAVGALSVAVALVLGRKKPKHGPVIGFVLATMLTVDLYQFGHRFLIMGDKSEFEFPEAVQTYLTKDADPGARILTPVTSRFTNSTMIFGGGNPGGYDIFLNKRFAQYLNAAAKRPLDRFLSYARVRRGSALLRHLGIRYLLSAAPLRDGRNRFFSGFEAFRPLRKIGPWIIHEDTDYLPRAFIVHHVEVIPKTDVRLQRLASPEFELLKTVVLEDPLSSFNVEPSPDDDETVAITSITPNRVTMNVIAKSNGILVMSDSLMPGWDAFVDGEHVPIIPANHVMRGVPITVGRHLVEMRYMPTGVIVGAIFSVISVLILVLGCAMYRKLDFRAVFQEK